MKKYRICYTNHLNEKSIIYKCDHQRFVIGLTGELYENNPRHEADAFYQQWTGLVDKNGIDVYQGDLVDFDIAISYGEIETFKNQEVKYCNENAVYVFGKDEFSMLDKIFKETLTVVGNTYEN